MMIAIMLDVAMPLDSRYNSRMMHLLAEEFALRGHEVAIITPFTEKQKLPLKVDIIGKIEIWRFRSGNTQAVSPERLFGIILRKLNEWFIGWRDCYAIFSRVKKEPFDLCVIHSHQYFFERLAKKY